MKILKLFQMTKKVIAYVRVSTEEQGKGLSIDSQKQRINDYCRANGFEILRTFEEKYSAKEGFDRPVYNELKKYLIEIKGKCDYILVTQWSRFSRDMAAALVEIKRLKALSIEANAIEQWYDLKSPENLLLFAINLAAPQAENDRLSLRVKSALVQGRKEGRYMGKAPFGYYNDKIAKLIFPHPQESKIVKFCFEKFREGLYSAEEVRKIAKERGFKLGKQAFLNMLKNKAYIGKVAVPNYKKEPLEWINGLHDAIIDSDLFDEVQYILSGKKKPYKGNSKSDETPLIGHLICPECGRPLTGSGSTSRNKNIYHYYHCQRKYGCKHTQSANYLNDKFIKLLQNLEPKPSVLNLYERILEEEFNATIETREEDRKRLEKQIEETNRRIELVDKGWMDEVISDEKHKSMSKKLDNELLELKHRYNTILQIPSEYSRYLKFGVSLIGNISGFYKEADLLIKKKLVGSIFPEKLIFVNDNYRTTKTNAFLEFFTLNINNLGIKKGGKFAALSTSAPESGLEPETL